MKNNYFWIVILAAMIMDGGNALANDELQVTGEVGEAQFVEPYTPIPSLTAHVPVTATIRNISSHDVRFSELACSRYDNWSTDNKAVRVDQWACAANVPIETVLEPGDTHESEIWLALSSKLSPGQVRFRLGYSIHKGSYYNSSITDDIEYLFNKLHPIWSDEIVLPIKEAPDAHNH